MLYLKKMKCKQCGYVFEIVDSNEPDSYSNLTSTTTNTTNIENEIHKCPSCNSVAIESLENKFQNF